MDLFRRPSGEGLVKVILAAILALAVGCPAWAQGPGRVIRVTGNADYPPLTWQDRKDPEKVTGFAIELLELAFKDLGIQVAGTYVGPWARAQANVRTGQVDMLAGAYITEERQTYMDYVTPPFVMDPTVIFVRKGDPLKFERWEDLIGLKGGAPIGNSFGEKFDQFEKAYLDVERVPVLDQAFGKLLAGRSRYVVYGLYPGLAEAEAAGLRDKLSYLPDSVISEGLYFTISKKSPFDTPEVRAYLSKKVKEFARQKLPERLMEKYLKLWREQNAP